MLGLTLVVPFLARADPEPKYCLGADAEVAIAATHFNRKTVPFAIAAYAQAGTRCEAEAFESADPQQKVLCRVGMLCASGCALAGTTVGLFVEQRLLATAITTQKGGWSAQIPIEELERGRLLTACEVGARTRVLDESSWNSLWAFTVEAGATWKERFGPAGGTRVGMFVAVTPLLHPMVGSPWFGIHLRYAAAQVSDEGLHRLGIGLDVDLAEAIYEAGNKDSVRGEYHGVRVVLSATAGGAFFNQNSSVGGNAIVAGPFAGASVQVVVPVARHVSVVLRTSYEWFLQGASSFQMVDLASLGAQAEF